MKTCKNHHEMEPGDTVVLKQENGLELQVIVASTGVMVKAPETRTRLNVSKTNAYAHFIKAETS